MPQPAQRNLQNHILSRLAPGDFRLLAPELKPVVLKVPKQLEAPNRRIELVYFIENGVASVVVKGAGGRSIEIGIIGREGMTGLAVVLGNQRSPYETFIQIAGDGHSIGAGALRQAIEYSAQLHHSLLCYALEFQIQLAQTVFATGHSTIEERLARWLLMAYDRVDGDELHLTHEFLSLMLGVRRESVSHSLSLLQHDGLIDTRRSVIEVLDRGGLEKRSRDFYSKPRH
jgi:CRP-like cAMP-binding protein